VEATAIELDGQYRALREECGALRRRVGMVVVRGAEAAEYLESQLTNEVETLSPPAPNAPGNGCYAALLDRKGRMQGDMRVLRIGDDELWLLCGPEALTAISSHLATYKVGREVETEELSDQRAVISLLGPTSVEIAGGSSLAGEHDHLEAIMSGVHCRVLATDLGVDLVCAAGAADDLLGFVAEAGAEMVSEAAAEIARVESGRPRFGREMTGDTIPQEAGINDRAVSFSKGCYIGQETVARLHYKGKPNRHLRGLSLDSVADAGDAIAVGEKQVGVIGTAVASPAFGPIALAILRREAGPGSRVAVGAGNEGEVVELPFRVR
jgi:folate-binding protein YgfZ